MNVVWRRNTRLKKNWGKGCLATSFLAALVAVVHYLIQCTVTVHGCILSLHIFKCVIVHHKYIMPHIGSTIYASPSWLSGRNLFVLIIPTDQLAQSNVAGPMECHSSESCKWHPIPYTLHYFCPGPMYGIGCHLGRSPNNNFSSKDSDMNWGTVSSKEIAVETLAY